MNGELALSQSQGGDGACCGDWVLTACCLPSGVGAAVRLACMRFVGRGLIRRTRIGLHRLNIRTVALRFSPRTQRC